MNLGEWYVLPSSDQDLYFRPAAVQKNGGMAGIFYTVDHRRPRAKAKPKKGSVDSISVRQVREGGRWPWRRILNEEVPFERFAEGGGDNRAFERAPESARSRNANHGWRVTGIAIRRALEASLGPYADLSKMDAVAELAEASDARSVDDLLARLVEGDSMNTASMFAYEFVVNIGRHQKALKRATGRDQDGWFAFERAVQARHG